MSDTIQLSLDLSRTAEAPETARSRSRFIKKNLAKSAAHVLGLGFATPALTIYMLTRPILGKQRAFTYASEHITRRPGILGNFARCAFYRCLCPDRIGQNVTIGFMTVFSKPAVTLENDVYIGRFCSIGWSHIEQGVLIADGVQILSGRHQHTRGSTPHYEKIRIGQGAWIGAGAIIMADVGTHAVVGAGAVVVQPIPPAAKVAGVPAREIKPAPA